MRSDHPLDRFLQFGHVLHVAADGRMIPFVPNEMPDSLVLLPGSFNPLHQGHWKLAAVAQEIMGGPIAFELSVNNVDKPMLACEEIRQRLSQFDGQATVWLTHSARFVEKAECFRGATFVVGADTALRIVLPRYYDGDAARMHAALDHLRARRCRFLVACRVDERGQCLRLHDLPIPSGFTELFEEIPPERFRWDISSTAIRSRP